MPKSSRKFRSKVSALKKIGNLPEKEAQALAKRAKLFRIKRRRVILHGPNREVIGCLLMQDGKLTLTPADGLQMEQGNDGTVSLALPEPPKKKAKKPAAEAEPPKKKGGKKKVDNGQPEK